MSEVILVCKSVKHGQADTVEHKKEKCNFCEDEVWVSATGIEHAQAKDEECKFMCMACALKHDAINKGQVMECSNTQLEEIASVMGCDVEKAKKLVDSTTKAFKQANAYKNN